MSHFHASLHEAVRNACADAGIGPLPDLPVIGQIRCPGIGKNKSNQACWINIKSDVAHIVDHSSGFKTSVFKSRELTPQDKVKFRRNQATAAKVREAMQQAAIGSANRAWKSAQPCTGTEYTQRKNIGTHGCRWYAAERCLLVPLKNVDGELRSLQRIYDNGKKLCWPGAPTKAAFFLIGRIETEILLCEGPGTGSTLYKHTGKAVVCVMFASNLLAVATALHQRYPAASITVCGDDDRDTDGNPGKTKATEAALAINAKLAMPKLCVGCGCTDFNDQANCPRDGSR